MSDETLLKFPCEFPIKVLGKAGLEFQATVLSIIRKHVPDLSEGAVSTRHSENENYVSVTVTINAQNQEQLDAIYQDLSDHEDVMIAL